MTTTRKRAAAPKGGGSRASKAEKKGRRTHEFEGLALDLPATLPPSFSLRYAKLAALSSRGDERAAGVVYDLLVSLLGEEQYDTLLDHIDSMRKRVDVTDLIPELIAEYGTDPGN